jgi:hypothetical protein
MDPSKLLRAKASSQALQQSPSRPAASPAVNPDDLRLPKLKNGPDADVFVKNADPAKAPANPPVERADKAPDTHFSGGKIVQPLNHDGAHDVAPAKTSLAEKLFGSVPRNEGNQFSQARLNMTKKPASTGLSSLLLSIAGLGGLSACVAGPAALLAKPGLVNQLVTVLPAKLP